MSCSSDIGLELFTAPFRSPQASMAFPASNQGTARPSQPPQAPATAPRQGTSAFPVQQAETPASVGQAQGPDVPEEPVPETKETEKVPEEPQAKAVDPTTGPKQKTQAQAQPEPPKKELSLGMSDHTIPAGKPMDASNEAKHKAEWETEQLAKKQAEEAAIQRLQSMSDADAVAAIQRLHPPRDRTYYQEEHEGMRGRAYPVCLPKRPGICPADYAPEKVYDPLLQIYQPYGQGLYQTRNGR